jgi:phosphoribosylamine--glycine ligase
MLPASSPPAAQSAPQARVVIEEFLEGEEASFIVMVDGKNVLPLASSQDHKRIGDGDSGPNTGGMGAYSPAPVVTPAVHARAMREIILPTVRGMAADGIPYTGFLYAGLMIGKDGSVKTVEFNCRLGDPETQPIMMRLKSDLLTLLRACRRRPAQPRRSQLGPTCRARCRARRGQLSRLRRAPATRSAACRRAARTATSSMPAPASRMAASSPLGGRVLCVTVLAENVRQAQKRAYELIIGIHFDGMQYRRDIGHRALHR